MPVNIQVQFGSLYLHEIYQQASYVVSSSFGGPSSVICRRLSKVLGPTLFHCLVANIVRIEKPLSTFAVLGVIRSESLHNTKRLGYCTRSFIKLAYTDSVENGFSSLN